jgi:hypothetical protein
MAGASHRARCKVVESSKADKVGNRAHDIDRPPARKTPSRSENISIEALEDLGSRTGCDPTPIQLCEFFFFLC